MHKTWLSFCSRSSLCTPTRKSKNSISSKVAWNNKSHSMTIFPYLLDDKSVPVIKSNERMIKWVTSAGEYLSLVHTAAQEKTKYCPQHLNMITLVLWMFPLGVVPWFRNNWTPTTIDMIIKIVLGLTAAGWSIFFCCHVHVTLTLFRTILKTMGTITRRRTVWFE